LKHPNEMKLKIVSLSLLFIAMFFSCKKDEQLIIPSTDSPLLSKVITNDQPYYEYSYNAANLVSQEISKYQFTKHSYNNKNQLLNTDYYWDKGILSSNLLVIDTVLNRIELVNPFNAVKSGSANYEYNINNQLIKSTYNRASAVKSEFSVFTYDGNNRISKQTLYWDNKVSGYINYYYDGKGNLIKEIMDSVTATGIAVLNTTAEYEFDDKQNPYKPFNSLMIPGINTNQNNIVKETCTIQSGVDQKTANIQVTQTLYEYNARGYPVKKNGTVKYVYL
jgi:hypothetical protein